MIINIYNLFTILVKKNIYNYTINTPVIIPNEKNRVPLWNYSEILKDFKKNIYKALTGNV